MTDLEFINLFGTLKGGAKKGRMFLSFTYTNGDKVLVVGRNLDTMTTVLRRRLENNNSSARLAV